MRDTRRTAESGYVHGTAATTVEDMSATTVITLAYDHRNPHLMTHLCEDGHTLCGKDAATMETFEVNIRGRRALTDFVDCGHCSRALTER